MKIWYQPSWIQILPAIKLWNFMVSCHNTALKNMLGTFKEYYFWLRVCTLPKDTYPFYEVYLTRV